MAIALLTILRCCLGLYGFRPLAAKLEINISEESAINKPTEWRYFYYKTGTPHTLEMYLTLVQVVIKAKISILKILRTEAIIRRKRCGCLL